MALGYYMMEKAANYFFLGVNETPPLQGKTPYLGLVTGHGADPADTWIEVYGGSYARRQIYFAIDSSGNMSLTSPIVFPTATGDWLNVVGAVVFDQSSSGYALFDIPWMDSNWDVVPSYHITSGCICTIYTLPTYNGLGAIWRQMSVDGNYSDTYGAPSAQFATEMMNWLFYTSVSPYTFPYPRTYSIAIGRQANSNPSQFYRFTGDWEECQGTGYNKVALAASDWEYHLYGINSYVTNKNEIVFTESAAADWGYVEDAVLYAGTTPAFWAHLDVATTITEGKAFSIEAGKIRIYIDGTGIEI